MSNKLKTLILVESIIIVILAYLLIFNNYNPPSDLSIDEQKGLLSSRVYAGLLQPGNLLIFNLKPLQKDLEQYIKDRNINLSLYIVNLRDGVSMGISANKEFDPASLNKLPIAIIIMRKVELGQLTLNTKILIKAEYLDEDSGTLYRQGANELTVGELLHYMLAESDNTAFKTLISKVSFEEMTNLSDYLNYYNPSLESAPPSPDNNLFIVTPKSTYNLFMSLYLSTILKPQSSEYILSALTNTSFDIKKFANLPEEVVVAQKYGRHYIGNLKLFHSCGIIYLKDSRFFYCVMTRDMDADKAQEATGEIVNKLYNYIIDLKMNLKPSNS